MRAWHVLRLACPAMGMAALVIAGSAGPVAADGPGVPSGVESSARATVVGQQDGLFTTSQTISVSPAVVEPGGTVRISIEQELTGPFYEARGRAADGSLTDFHQMTSACPPNPSITFDNAPTAQVVVAFARDFASRDLVGSDLPAVDRNSGGDHDEIAVIDDVALTTVQPVSVVNDAGCQSIWRQSLEAIMVVPDGLRTGRYRIALPNNFIVQYWTDNTPGLIEYRSGELPVLSVGAAGFAASVPSPAEINLDPFVLAQSAALALGVLLLMPFPAQLFNSTLENHYDEVRRWFRWVPRWPLRVAEEPGVSPGPDDPALAARRSRPAHSLALGAFLAATAILYGLLDPGFGFTLSSAAVFVGLLLGLALTVWLLAAPSILRHWRQTGDRGRAQAVPGSLLVAAGCVLVSRLTGFEPGYLYGALIGVTFLAEVGEVEQRRRTAWSAAWMILVAVGAWLLLGAFRATGVGDPFATIVDTALATLVVAGLEGAALGLLPIRGLPGEPIFRHSRASWALLEGIALAAFFHVLVNPQSGYLADSGRIGLTSVVILFVAFGITSVAFWWWFEGRHRRKAPREPDPAVPLPTGSV